MPDMRSCPALEKFRRRTGVAGLVLLGVICRALIPVGFMPAALGAGGPVAVCHGGLAGEFFRQLAAQTGAVAMDDAEAAHVGHGGGNTGHTGHDRHAGDGDDSDTAHEAWEHCPAGSAFGAIAIGAAFEFTLPVLKDQFEPAGPAALLRRQFAYSYRARAPPALPPLV